MKNPGIYTELDQKSAYLEKGLREVLDEDRRAIYDQPIGFHDQYFLRFAQGQRLRYSRNDRYGAI